jgi:hypothetical protein
MTQAGFSGNPRYVRPAVAALSVLAGVGAANLAQLVPTLAAVNGSDQGVGLLRGRLAQGLDEFWSISTDFSSSPRERPAAGAASARLRVGSFRVYRRDEITFPLARGEWKVDDAPLQDFCREFTPAIRERIPTIRVVTR